MLVLSRRRNEAVQIGETISVTVVEVRGDIVRLGFVAPNEVPIWRNELEGFEGKTRSAKVRELAGQGES